MRHIGRWRIGGRGGMMVSGEVIGVDLLDCWEGVVPFEMY
jgi:hypothetical protein